MVELDEKRRCRMAGPDTGITVKRSFCDICAPGPHCGVRCYVRDGRLVRIEGDPDHPVNRGLLCARGYAARQYVYRKDRVLTPLRRVGRRGEGRFEPVSWEEALDEIASRLTDVRDTYGASAAAFYSGYNKWYRPFLRRLCHSFGSVNYGTESSSCFTSTLMSWRLAAGCDAAMPDLSRSGLCILWGSNPAWSAHLLARRIADRHGRGMKVIVVDPRRTPAAERADLWLRVRPGTDCALALGIARELIVNGRTDAEYIAAHVHGFDEFSALAREFPPERTEAVTGVSAEELRLAARMIGENAPLSVQTGGASLVHGANGMQTHRAVMALTAVTGSFDRPGGMLPVPLTYAHSMAGFTTGDEEFAAETYPKNAGVEPVGAARFPLWAELVGEMQANDLARQILEGTPYPVRALYAHGLNHRMFAADGDMVRALEALDFFVDVDLFLTDTAKYADILLPCCSSLERSEFKVFGGGYAQLTEPVIAPPGLSRPDDEILCALARRLTPDDALLCAGPEACVRRMLEGTPVDYDALKADRQRPHRLGAEPSPAGRHVFRTPTGKFELKSEVIGRFAGLDPLPSFRESSDGADPAAFPFLLAVGARLPNALHSRLHDVPWLRSLRPEPLAELSADDAAALGISPGDVIRIRTAGGSLTVKALPTASVPPGAVYLYHGYREADGNAVVPAGHNDPYSGFPGYRCVRCDVRKEAG